MHHLYYLREFQERYNNLENSIISNQILHRVATKNAYVAGKYLFSSQKWSAWANTIIFHFIP